MLLGDAEFEVDVAELRQSPKDVEDDVDSARSFSGRFFRVRRRRMIAAEGEDFDVVGVARDDEGEEGGEVVGRAKVQFGGL